MRTEVPLERPFQAEHAIAQNAVVGAAALLHKASNRMTVRATLRVKFETPSEAANQDGQATQHIKRVQQGADGWYRASTNDRRQWQTSATMLKRGALRPSGVKKGPRTRSQDIGGASRRQGPGCLQREAARRQQGRQATGARGGKLALHHVLLVGTSSHGPAVEQYGRSIKRGGGVVVAAAARCENKGVDNDARLSDNGHGD